MAGAHGIGRGVQVNDPALDNIQFFPNALPQPQRPYEFSIQSETTAASFGTTVVVGFNNSADQPVTLTAQNTVAFQHRFLSAVGVSHDGGQTFKETSLPPIPGSPFTFGDPALAVDRHGNFYYASLGANAAGNSLIFVGKSSDGGDTFAPGVTVALDPGADKEWIASGPDPLNFARDNVYVTWTSFGTNHSVLKLGRSTDGGQTWTVSTIFTPVDDGVLSAFLQFSNPVVDRFTGRLYIPFLHGGDGDADYFRVLASDDGGLTFHLLNFNVPGAPDAQTFPVIGPGTLADCGVTGGFRAVLHQGPDLGGGRLGLPVFRNATRLITQPSFAAVAGRLFIAFNASTSQTFGDPASRSEIKLLFSPNAGGNWLDPLTVAPATDAAPQHVHPAISTDLVGARVSIGYYVQQADGKLRVDALSGVAVNNLNSVQLVGQRVQSLSPAFDLIPSNNPLPSPPFAAHTTTNYARTIRPCYDIGEYMAASSSLGGTIFAFGDNRNTWTSPPESPAAGVHTQPDVFAVRFSGDD
ncbi:MAG TPA: sialidase family protein, partial [Candidatus Eisenbacteria bacterium]|nr:sialidase family protein [Candidatus Eisenbacteria bacterium]